MIIGENRKEVRSVAGDALMHRASEGRQRPAPYAGLRVGGDVGRIDRSERCLQPISAGKWLSILACVADGAVSDAGENPTPGDLLVRKAGPRRSEERRVGKEC